MNSNLNWRENIAKNLEYRSDLASLERAVYLELDIVFLSVFWEKGNMMQVLWAPWRLDYILEPKPDECVFCLPALEAGEDKQRLVLYRGKQCFVLMNKFPYNNGHLMICPYRHVSCVTELQAEELHESTELIQCCVKVLNKAFKPQGINVGLNLGDAAGAGIAAHIHWQLVPRWCGDSSFMAVFSESRVIPEHLLSTYEKLKPLFSLFMKKE